MSLSELFRDIQEKILGVKMTESEIKLMDQLREDLKSGKRTLDECREIWSREVTPI